MTRSCKFVVRCGLEMALVVLGIIMLNEIVSGSASAADPPACAYNVCVTITDWQLCDSNSAVHATVATCTPCSNPPGTTGICRGTSTAACNVPNGNYDLYPTTTMPDCKCPANPGTIIYRAQYMAGMPGNTKLATNAAQLCAGTQVPPS